MSKIRLRDLASRLNLPEQDLMFKLRSIGVRLEGGDNPTIDSDVIQAILQGKRMPPPREVILRDDGQEEEPPQVQRSTGSAPGPLRPQRRAMIHRVEPKIRELEVKRKADQAAAEAKSAAERSEAAKKTAAEAAADKSDEEAKKRAQAAKAEAEAAAKEAAEKAAAAKAAREEAEAERKRIAAEKAQAIAREKAAAEAAKKKALAQKAAEQKKLAARPKPEPKRRNKNRARIIALPPNAPKAARTGEGHRQAVSERGKRRAQRRQEEKSAQGLVFKENKPEGTVTITPGMTVREFAEKLGVKAKDLIKVLLQRGVMATINHVLDVETATQLAQEVGVDVMEVSFEEEIQLQAEEEQTDLEKHPRAPVVTVMGHVDHGKTSLLDAIRKTKVAEGEAGGITQHIGAYHVDVGERQIVFLDTPGHEAFTMMRARGAKVTDIVILVVAADDGVMPQTLEAIDHARAADVPIVVAINKIDKPNANVEKLRKELADAELLLEDWGGDTVSVQVSALQRQGIDDLLEMLLLTSEMLELKAVPDLPARGVVLEARKEVGRGIISTVVVQDGSLRKGDVFVAGSTWGRVRTMIDDRGRKLDAAGPATAVEVTGFGGVPSAGDLLQVYEDESKAREISSFRQQREREAELAPKIGKISLENLFDQMGKDEVKELPVVVKADVHGSVEVLKDSLEKLSTDKVNLKVIHAAVGAISNHDVLLASASNAVVVGFNVRPERNASQLAEQEGIDIRLHTVIYELLDEIKAAMAGLLDPTFQEVQQGTAEVRELFKVPKIGLVAGCHVLDGVIPRSAQARLLRDNVVVWEGKLASLRRFKDDVAEVRSGFECGIGLEGFQDVKPGDLIEAFTKEEVAATL
ncbi:MAG: translation initiation factor IF-2 [Thermoanaerobaculia bacterium]|nr:translation initiation factor IF-2 [Thermoanaerobaculia bacterium]